MDILCIRCWIRCSMLNLLFRVRFFFCFSNSIIYWLSVRLCTLYIYDDMALVITITIVRERIGNSVLFLYVTVLSPYRTCTQFSSCEFQVNIFAVRWFTIVLLACNETCPMNSYRYLKDASKYDFISQGWINCCNAWLITHSI